MKDINFINIQPVLPTSDIERDILWYNEKMGFELVQTDKMYAVLKRENLFIHLQWHAGTEDDPINGGTVIKVFVTNLLPLFDEFIKRGTINQDQLKSNTPWGTNEFGLFDLNKNAIFFVEDL